MDQRIVGALIALIIVCASVLAYRGTVPSEWLIAVVGTIVAWLLPSPMKMAK
jgi:hypothetical protein